jgi:hypothetical protein
MRETDEEPPAWAKNRVRELEANKAEGEMNRRGNREARVPDIPVDAVDETERLTRLARDAAEAAEAEHYRARRREVASDYGYTPRVREADDTLVLYPAEWVESGEVQLDRVNDTARAVEVSLSGPGDADRYRAVAAYNDAVVEAVAEHADEVHVENARSFATFASNHYVRPVDDVTPEMRAEFREEYFPRNAWPTAAQVDALGESLELVTEIAAALDDPRP